jgi:hypothetical protein
MPQVIGKSAKPRCFKGRVTLPTEYDHNKKAWMTAGIFCEWVKKMDRRMTGMKVALLLDNCPAHPKVITRLKNITIFYLPPNTTSIPQPMDQGIIRNFKYYYKSSLNNRQVRCLDSGSEFTVSVLDALTEAQRAWTQVKKETIQNCWAHMAFRKYKEADIPDDVCVEGLTRSEFEDFVGVDDKVITAELPTDEGIISEALGAKEDGSSDEEADSPEPPKSATIAEALAACEVLREYLMAHPNKKEMIDRLCSIEGDIKQDEHRQILLDQNFWAKQSQSVAPSWTAPKSRKWKFKADKHMFM